MTLPVRPSGYPRWADSGATAIVEPPSGKKDVGWGVGEKPPAQFFNWLQNNAYQWIQYFDKRSPPAWQPAGPPFVDRDAGPSLIMEYKGFFLSNPMGGRLKVLGLSGAGTAKFALPLRVNPSETITNVEVRGINGATGAPVTCFLVRAYGYTGTSVGVTAVAMATATGPSGINKEWFSTLSPTAGSFTMDGNSTLWVEFVCPQINDAIYGIRAY